MVVFKMRESVPTARYSSVCNVLRQWKTSLILTYRVYHSMIYHTWYIIIYLYGEFVLYVITYLICLLHREIL